MIWSYLVVEITNSEDYLTIFYFVFMTSIIVGQIELIVVQFTLDTSLAVTSVFAVICVFIFASGAIFPWPGLQVRNHYIKFYYRECFFLGGPRTLI